MKQGDRSCQTENPTTLLHPCIIIVSILIFIIIVDYYVRFRCLRWVPCLTSPLLLQAEACLQKASSLEGQSRTARHLSKRMVFLCAGLES
jgi:hypothetical protein